MIFCAIVPPGTEKELLSLESPAKGAMVFADIAFRDAKYRDFYAAYAGWKVMDNQIYEKQQPLDPLQLTAMARAIRPNILVIPDKRGDVDTTIGMIQVYTPRLLKGGIPSSALFGVVQGKTLEENRRCMEYLASALIAGVCIPMRVDGRTLSRIDLYNQVVRPLLPSHMKVHLLGVEAWPYSDEEKLKSYPEIVSIDTAEPTSAAYYGYPIEGSALAADDFGARVDRPKGFMDDASIKDQLRLNKELLWQNFSALQTKLASPSDPRVTRTES